jgi:hypothetical protein
MSHSAIADAGQTIVDGGGGLATLTHPASNRQTSAARIMAQIIGA